MLLGRQRSIVGLDIGSSSVKAIELTRSGQRLVVTGMGSTTIESPEEVADAVQQLLRETGIKSKRCVTAVSGRSVIIRQVPMVQVPDNELRQAVEYEADKYIPFDVNEVAIDAQRLEDGADAAGQMKVLLVAVKKALIDEHIALLQSVGLAPVIIDVDCFALGNAFELRNLSLGIDDQEVRALVDIGASKTNINIMRGNMSFFQREIYVAGNDLTEAVAKRFGEDPRDVEKMKVDPGGALESMQDAMLPVLEDIGSEIRLSFDYFENQYDQPVKEVFLSGGSVLFPGMDTMLSQVFSLPTHLWDPLEGLEVANYSTTMSSSNSEMTVSLGLAARILGTMGLTTRSIQPSAAPGAAPAPGRTGTATTAIPLPEALSPAENSKHWGKGIGLGVAGATLAAAACAFANTSGYAHWWVICEGALIGAVGGLGLWQGIKSVRPYAGRGAVVGACFLATVIACGALLGLRHTQGQTIIQRTTPKATDPAPTSNINFSDLPPDMRNLQFRNRPKASLDSDDITGVVFIFTHWLLSCATAMIMIAVMLTKLMQGASPRYRSGQAASAYD
ncbi:MAG: type IV pilus assembly protein PilM [Planctomycetota bacterium]|nr:type IV pilus assembly protein PilM [Planctomycetota bacterium]